MPCCAMRHEPFDFNVRSSRSCRQKIVIGLCFSVILEEGRQWLQVLGEWWSA